MQKGTALRMSGRAQQSARTLRELRVASSEVESGYPTAVTHKVIATQAGSGAEGLRTAYE